MVYFCWSCRSVIHVEQIWDPLTEESTLEWYQDDYQEPSEEIQSKQALLLVLILTALFYGWIAFMWLSPPFDYLLKLNIYNPLLFLLMIIIAFYLVVVSLLAYNSEYYSMSSALILIGCILTLPISLFSLYIWYKYSRKIDLIT
ncbi:MAG: hypothetical protein ACXAC7_18860 [Candidatus Hodarchaeales archaeon]